MQRAKSRTETVREEDDELYPINELARIKAKCSSMHIRRLVTAGVLPVVDIATPGSPPKLRVRASDWAAYVQQQTRSVNA